jgi:hypothetical protein
MPLHVPYQKSINEPSTLQSRRKDAFVQLNTIPAVNGGFALPIPYCFIFASEPKIPFVLNQLLEDILSVPAC